MNEWRSDGHSYTDGAWSTSIYGSLDIVEYIPDATQMYPVSRAKAHILAVANNSSS